MSFHHLRARARVILQRLSRFFASTSLASLLAFALIPVGALACACGCGVFDIGIMLPTTPGGIAFLEYDYMNQNKNWSGLSHAPSDDNSDKGIRTDFYTAGAQYLFENGVGLTAEVPYWDRGFTTDTGDGIPTFHHSAFGDVRLTASYSGFSSDNSTGISFGIKLPTGDYTYQNFDRDTEIGSGSTDLSFGVYHVGSLSDDGMWRYFSQIRYQFAIATSGPYRPGNELDGIVGVSYDAVMSSDGIGVTPIFQIIGSTRMHDTGDRSNPMDSGYSRVLLAPGVEVSFNHWTLHAEVDFPVYQNVIGNQLIAQQLFKTNLAYAF
jgi:hypothetical protein